MAAGRSCEAHSHAVNRQRQHVSWQGRLRDVKKPPHVSQKEAADQVHSLAHLTKAEENDLGAPETYSRQHAFFAGYRCERATGLGYSHTGLLQDLSVRGTAVIS